MNIITMSFRLLPADITDVPAMMRISKAAFSDDPVVGRIWRDCDKEVQFEHDVRVYGKHMRNRALTGEVFTKVVEEETGYVRFYSCLFFLILPLFWFGRCIHLSGQSVRMF